MGFSLMLVFFKLIGYGSSVMAELVFQPERRIVLQPAPLLYSDFFLYVLNLIHCYF